MGREFFLDTLFKERNNFRINYGTINSQLGKLSGYRQ
jgi:hypothetical protein